MAEHTEEGSVPSDELASKKITETQRLVNVVNAFKVGLKLEDAQIKKILKDSVTLPRSFPKKWGGKFKEDADADKNKPKPPNNPYIQYYNVHYDSMVEQRKDLNGKQITAKIAEQWKALSVQEKEKYVKMYEDDKIRHQQEMKAYDPEYISKIEAKAKNIKRSRTPYQVFYYERKEQVIKDHPEDYTKVITELWKNMSKEDKAPYEEQSKLAKEEFLKNNPEAAKKEKAKAKKKTKAKKAQAEEEEEA